MVDGWVSAETTMHCPHACPSPCSTCERSAAAQDLRRMRRILDELAMNAENVVAGGLPHFSRKEFAERIAERARWALQTGSPAAESK